jgi:hypothetical protein
MSYYALTLGGGGGGSGTVTSVSWTGGIVSIATATTTPAFTIAGTSGGIVYFDSATTWASSGVLAANALVVGGGAGAAPSTVTTGTGVVTALGVNTGTAGAFVVNGGVLGTPSSGTVTNLTGTASININGTVGATTASTGAFTSVTLNGATSGTVTIAAPAVAGTQSYTLPSAVPAANGYALTATTGGVMSWSAITASAGGSNTQVQYNNSGSLAGSADLVFSGSNLFIGPAITTTASGNLLIGTSTAGAGAGYPVKLAIDSGIYDNSIFKCSAGGNAACITAWGATTTGDNIFSYFATETSVITVRGSIRYNRAGGLVAYNTTSDYRAKDIYGPVTNSGELIDSVPVYMGKMKGATQERPMFIAHETPAYAHTGEKDAVKENGDPIYQEMDVSALIPVLWAEVKLLRARIAALEAK